MITEKRGMSTPWGPAQHVEHIADGIVAVDAAGHGGIHLSRERAAQMRRVFPDFRPFTGCYTWWEEDCDAAIVVIAFPECFPADQVARAREFALKSDYYAPLHLT